MLGDRRFPKNILALRTQPKDISDIVAQSDARKPIFQSILIHFRNPADASPYIAKLEPGEVPIYPKEGKYAN